MILVTGGTGLIGSYLLKDLVKQGQPVRALYRSAKPSLLSDEEKQMIDWIQCDILDVVALDEAMQGVEYVYHVAGLVSFDPAKKEELHKINIEGTANVVNASLNAAVKKLVHVSSVAALGRKRPGQEITEAQNWTPETSNSVYGQSKYFSEMEVWRAVSEGLNAVIVNPVIVLGYGDWNTGSLAIFKNAYEEFPWYTEGVSGFVDVRDVSRAMIALMKSNISGQRFILSGDNWKYQDVFSTAAKYFGKKAPHKKVTPFLSSIIWRLEKMRSIFTGQSPLLTKETALTARTKVYFNNKKIQEYLPGFSFTPLEETIRWSCEEFKKNLQKA
jgi:nucleoside-diphosphate-sugar epimerase